MLLMSYMLMHVSLSQAAYEHTALGTQMYKEAGVPSTSFTGVPVFQAQGLTVKTERSRYTPLFLAKEDLDVAVGAAFSQREAAREAATRNKAAVAEEELASARTAVRTAAQFILLAALLSFCKRRPA